MNDRGVSGRAGTGVNPVADLASLIDHTLLRPDASAAEVRSAVLEAVGFGCASVCVQPAMVPAAFESAAGSLPVCAVVGFPHGANLSETKAVEASGVVALGASEVDMVADLSALADSDYGAVASDVARVRAAVPHVLLKVILESALWNDAQLRAACDAALDGGADFVKTSTGFHPSGGATEHAVGVMAERVGGRAMVKASGGIRDLDTARRMVDAGAARLGLSATAAILSELS